MVRPSILESVFGCLSSSFLGPGVEQGTGGVVGRVFLSFCPWLTNRGQFIGSSWLSSIKTGILSEKEVRGVLILLCLHTLKQK